MATYNWSYRPNVPNKYQSDTREYSGFLVAESNDSVRPNNCCYVALFGNDDSGNGSRIKPYRSIAKGISVTNRLIIGSGTWRENCVFNADYFLYGDGDVIFDLNFVVEIGFNPSGRGRYFDMKVVNNLNSSWSIDFGPMFFNCILDNYRFAFSQRNDRFLYMVFQNCVLSNFHSTYDKLILPSTERRQVGAYTNNTFVNIRNLCFEESAGLRSIINSIHDNCDISFLGDPLIDYCLFHKCRYRFGSLDDFISINSKEDLISFVKSVYPNNNSFQNCVFKDPKFNNPIIGDYSLAFDSPAKNMSYFGTYIGAQSIGYAIKANVAGGDFDLSTNTNLIFSDNSIVLANPTSEGSIESNVIANIMSRELSNAPVFGFYADRNGQYLDATEDLSAATISVGTNLISNTPYLVENAAITYNGAVIQPGERFTTTDVLSFASASNGSCREILEAPQRHTILARFSDGGTVLTSGTALAVGAWYYANGPVNYEGVAYTNQVFKAISTNPFTGSGNVILAMADEAYQLYEPGIKFTSNNAGNTRTGTIIRGNGDPLYERGLEKEFPINAKFIQFRYIIKVNNLRP